MCDAQGRRGIAASPLSVARVRRRRAASPGVRSHAAAAHAAMSGGCSGVQHFGVCVLLRKRGTGFVCRAEWCGMAAGGAALARAERARKSRVRARVRERSAIAHGASRCTWGGHTERG